MSTASLNLDGKSYELPVIRGTEHETAVDITKLLQSVRCDHDGPGLQQYRGLPEFHHVH